MHVNMFFLYDSLFMICWLHLRQVVVVVDYVQ